MAGHPSTVTVFGYREDFAVKPSVKVFCNGTRIGSIPPCKKMEFNVNGPVELMFKCAFRSAKCMAKGGDCVLLSFNRVTGELNATVAGAVNLQSAMTANAEKDNRNWIVAATVIALLGGLCIVTKIAILVLRLCIAE